MRIKVGGKLNVKDLSNNKEIRDVIKEKLAIDPQKAGEETASRIFGDFKNVPVTSKPECLRFNINYLSSLSLKNLKKLATDNKIATLKKDKQQLIDELAKL